MVPGELKDVPAQPIRPVDQIEVADIVQRALVRAPLGTPNTDQPIIGTFHLRDDLFRRKHGYRSAARVTART